MSFGQHNVNLRGVAKRLVVLSCLLLLAACSEAPVATIPVYQVGERSLEVVIPGSGELEAASAQLITTPGRNPMTIAWLAEENTQVKQGDIVARFDAEQLTLDSRKEELEMMLLDRDIHKKRAEKDQKENDLDSEKVLIGKEFIFVDTFAIDDLRLYSKLEIIDTLSNRDYLGAKEQFIEWKQDSIGEQIQSSVEVLDIRKDGHLAKYNQHKDALAALEVVAPYDGMLIFEKDWRGEKPSVGQTVFPGSVIAKIPNLSVMQARAYVLDKNAIGLKVGQAVKVTLEAHPGKQFSGTLASLSGFSRTIKRGNPTKYFELTVTLNDKSAILQPGSKVSVEIVAAQHEPQIVVPLQAIFNEQGNSFVYVQQGTDFVRRAVKAGQKNLYFVQISEGLSSGEVVALSEPDSSAAQENNS